MEFMMLVWVNEVTFALTHDDLIEWIAFNQEVRDSGALVFASTRSAPESSDSAEMRRVEPTGGTAHQSPNDVRIQEVYILCCTDLDDAIRWARRFPAARGATVEILSSAWRSEADSRSAVKRRAVGGVGRFGLSG